MGGRGQGIPEGGPAAPIPAAERTTTTRAWRSYIAEDLPRSVRESTDSAVRSARSLHDNSSIHLRSLQGIMPEIRSKFRSYEDDFFNNARGVLTCTKDHPAIIAGVAITASILLLPGPRRFLLRHKLARLQGEEAKFVKAEKHVKELSLSIDLMKKESRKLLERAALAEKEMKQGKNELMNFGMRMNGVTRSVSQVEAQAVDLMDLLREIPGREALQLRAQAASLASVLKQQRSCLDKRMTQISELGVQV